MVLHISTVFAYQLLSTVIGSSHSQLLEQSLCFGTYFWYFAVFLIIGPSFLPVHWLAISGRFW